MELITANIFHFFSDFSLHMPILSKAVMHTKYLLSYISRSHITMRGHITSSSQLYRMGGGRNGEWLVKGYKVTVMQDK